MELDEVGRMEKEMKSMSLAAKKKKKKNHSVIVIEIKSILPFRNQGVFRNRDYR